MGWFGEKRKLEVICLLKRTCSPPTVLIVLPPSSDFSEFEAYDALEIISSAGMIAEMQTREYFFFLSRYIISRVAGYKTRYKSTRESKSQLVNFWLAWGARSPIESRFPALSMRKSARLR